MWLRVLLVAIRFASAQVSQRVLACMTDGAWCVLVSWRTACAIYGIDAHPTKKLFATAGGGA